MSLRVDLNADMGESFGAWRMGDDPALLRIVTSANVACGFHAGDPDVMAATIAAAAAAGVEIGAHPGFADLQGFGRRRMVLPLGQITNLVAYQVAAAAGMTRAAGTRLRHVKLHGALANMAAEDAALAAAAYRGALGVAPDLTIMAMAGTAQVEAAADLGAPIAHEVFADRGYGRDGRLLDRATPGAVLHDPEAAAARAVAMVEAAAILPEGAAPIPTPIDTICLHGDTPGAVEMGHAVKTALAAAGIRVAPFDPWSRPG